MATEDDLTEPPGRVHALRIRTDAFQRIYEGHRHHIARADSPKFEINDVLILKEYNPDTDEYTDRQIQVVVTDLERAPHIFAGWIVMSIQHISIEGDACCKVRKERFG